MVDKFFDKSTINFIFGNKTWNDFLMKLKEEFEENANELENFLNIDNNYYDYKIGIANIKLLLDSYKNMQTIDRFDVQNVIVIYNGNPINTIKICLEAILYKKRIVIDPQDFMLGINKFIVTIINNVLELYKIYNLIKLENLLDLDSVNRETYIYCVDAIESYEYLMRIGAGNVEQKNIETLAVYCENTKFIELKDSLYDYCDYHNIVANEFDDTPKEKIADILNRSKDFAYVLLLTHDEDLKNEFKNKIKNATLVINENPYRDITKHLKIFE